MTTSTYTRKRGRPPKVARENHDTKAELIRSGLAYLTEYGFVASGLDAILKNAGVPKGSFYHYFASKDAFGEAVLAHYNGYFSAKLDTHLLNTHYSPLKRLENFVHDATEGMARYQFKRGCLVGNLGQEVDTLPASFRAQLTAIFTGWQERVATCLKAAQQSEEINSDINCSDAAEFFWIGWEGAVSRAKLMQNGQPLQLFFRYFLTSIT